jgi:LysR family transcriptional regulator, glycine cleavage system transcriptional activator
MPSLAVLRCFEAAARHESFTMASEELHLTQSAVSRQVRELENIVGFTLFRRVGRRVVLTEAGHRFADTIATDLDRLRQSVATAMAAGGDRRALRIASLPTFANRWLIPRLVDFEARHPDVQVSLATRLEPFDFARERFDLAIHFGREDWPGVQMWRLCEEEMVAVAAPAFVDQYRITSAADLVGVPLLHLETRPHAWPDWFRMAGLATAADTGEVRRGMFCDQFSMIITAALEGLGAALLPADLIDAELADGQLRQLAPARLQTDMAYHVVAPAGADDPARDRFIAWIRGQFADS